jgi:hypothetical protein
MDSTATLMVPPKTINFYRTAGQGEDHAGASGFINTSLDFVHTLSIVMLFVSFTTTKTKYGLPSDGQSGFAQYKDVKLKVKSEPSKKKLRTKTA